MAGWRKLGRLYDPRGEGRHPKLATHAANPLPVHIEDDLYRVFYSGRDARNRSSVGAVDIDIVRREVVEDHSEPSFEHGPTGSFYADGVSVGNLYAAGDRHFILFMAWQVPPDAHWRGDIGRLAVGRDLSLELDGNCPFMGSDAVDPVSLSYPWVMGDEASGFRMWYGSTVAWDAGNGEMLHVINHATSADGHRWARHGQAVPHALGVAQAFSRPTVLERADGTLDMWFSYRNGLGQTYRIGRAISEDGESWRLDLPGAGIAPSDSGWDSEMIAYPFAFRHCGEVYLLYNGNGYGRTGFGLAVWEPN